MTARGWLLRSAALAPVALLAACGGGGGVASTPTPIAATPDPTPTPTPTPTATPLTPTTGNDTAEYRATAGAVSMNALAAYNAGATGAGIGLAIIDTGINAASPEFTGRISAASQAVGGEGSIQDQDGHGTAVAFTAAGRRDGANTLGVAFGATVIALRADTPGSCTTASAGSSDSSCTFSTTAIATGVDAARTAGARVINLSLGGTAMPANLQAAIGRATAAGIVVVIAAGNDGATSPGGFTGVATTADAHGAVIIAGSVGSSDQISSFSDRAGASAAVFLSAVGERVRAPDNNGTAYLWSGTSFSTPQIAGAAALLAQAFPNLSGAQIVTLLLTTARDAGDAGTDAVYGRGILDLTKAFAPAGTTGVAGVEGARVAIAGTNGVTSAAMGDARPTGAGAVILDGFGRAYTLDLAASIARTTPSPGFTAALASTARTRVTTFAGGSLSVTLAPVAGGVAASPLLLAPGDAGAARAVAASVTERLGQRTSFALAARGGSDALVESLAGRAEPAFLVARTDGLGFDGATRTAAALRRQLGPWGLTAAAESGDVLTSGERLLPGRADWTRSPYRRTSLALDRRFGGLAASLSATRLTERDTLLGARFAAGLGAPGGTSWFLAGTARWQAGAGWTLGGTLREGWTAATLHGLNGDGRLRTAAFAADLGKEGLFGRSDSWGVRVAQPLRVASGGLDLLLPTAYDYATASVTAWSNEHLGLAPTGRELDVEARYARPFAGGAMDANLFWRRDPGNWATLPPDRGAALRWSRPF